MRSTRTRVRRRLGRGRALGLAALVVASSVVAGSAVAVVAAAPAVAAPVTASAVKPAAVTPADAATPADIVAQPSTPATVTDDALPTWQIDGVVWAQVTIGDIVYATGQFNYARPPGTAAGDSSEVTRGGLLAYNITTGNLVTSFAPYLSGTGLALAVSPDQSRLYVAGDFTQVNGDPTHADLAAFDVKTGALINTWAPTVNAKVRAITATNTSVYVGGDFTMANGNAANYLAAFSASTGALENWNASASASVTAMTMSPDLSRVVVAGRFDALGTTSRYGIGTLDATTGAVDTWDDAFPVKDAGDNASITSLSADGTNVYGTAYDFGTGGNFEGRFAVNPSNGQLVWMDSCHGDSYDATPIGSVLYSVGHAHDCSDTSSFDQMANPQRAQAETIDATGVAAHNNDTGNANYHDLGGQPANTLLPWYPTLVAGTFTGQGQAAWSVTGNATYVSLGGEFPTVNGTAQQGLVRFAIRSVAPNKVKPVSDGSLKTTVSSVNAGTVLVSWRGTSDPDNAVLTYTVYRDGGATPIYTTTAESAYFAQPQLSFLDTGLAPGSTHTYVVHVADPSPYQSDGFSYAQSGSVTVAGTGARTPYETAITGDGASNFWPLSETGGTTASDHIGGNDFSLLSVSGVTRGAAGPTALTSSTGSAPATTFNGTSNGTGQSIGTARPQGTISVEGWMKTSTAGGQLIDYGLTAGRASAITTDTLYVTPAGKLAFAVWTPTGYRAITSPSAVDDGGWHYVVGTMSPSSGTVLYVDGKQVAADTSTTTARAFLGMWKVAGDNVKYLPSAPSSPYFKGSLADLAVYPTALSAAQVAAHFTGAGVSNAAPTAAFTSSCSGLVCSTNGSGSTDSDGTVASYAWNFGDGTTGTGATPSHSYSAAGTYSITLTVTDNDGLTGSVTNDVTVAADGTSPPQPVAAISCTALACSFDGSASTDANAAITDYAWNFGDGTTAAPSTGDGETVTHSYAVAGDYPVTLTITDASGATASVQRTAVPTPPPNTTVLASDTFNRTVKNGFGTADTGGTWSSPTFAASNLSVQPGAGLMSIAKAGVSAGAQLSGVSSTSTDTTVTFSASSLATGSGSSAGTYLYVVGRNVATNKEYRGRLKLLPSGAMQAAITYLDGSSGDTVIGNAVTLSTTYAPGTQLNMDLSVSGTSPTSLALTVYKAGTDEPSTPSVTASDSTADLQAPGTIGVASTLGSAATAATTISVLGLTSTNVVAAPTASFTATCTNLNCTADASASSSDVTSYAWSFGDGATTVGSSSKSVAHSFTKEGVYRITLTVTNAAGYTSLQRQTVSVDQPPTPSFTSSCTTASLSCTFDASKSTDIDGSVLTYAWDFGDGYTSTGVTTSHTYASAGTFTVTLTVTDDMGTARSVSHPANLGTANKAPMAAFVVTCDALSCTFDGSTSSDPDGTVVSWAWDFGDGTTTPASASSTATHTYSGPNRVTTSLTVTDNDGATNTATYIVQTRAADVPPVAAFTFNCISGHVCTFNGRNSTDSDGSVVQWAWNFGDHSTGSGDFTSHTYATDAPATVTLTVYDDDNVTDTVTHQVIPYADSDTATAATVRASSTRIFPYADKYLDSTELTGSATTTSKTAGASITGTGALRVLDSAGKVVVSRATTDSAPLRLIWNGKVGKRTVPGRYTAQYQFTDEHQNAVSKSETLYVSLTQANKASVTASPKTVHTNQKSRNHTRITVAATTSTGRRISGHGRLTITSASGHVVQSWATTTSAAHAFTWNAHSGHKLPHGRFVASYTFTGPEGKTVRATAKLTVES